MNFIFTAVLSLAVTFASLFGAYRYLPLSALEGLKPQETRLGSTITTIQGSDTISSSRGVINTNFANLNAGKVENATTTMASLTTLSNLSTVGTITSGTWSGTAIAVNKGGTGTTTPSTYQVILGNGTNGLTVASSTGTSGQFLTSNGSGAYPSWQSTSVDQSATYTWTGTHAFNGTMTQATSSIGSLNVGSFNATSTIATSTVNNLRIANNATTTNITISGTQTGGTWSYTGSSTVFTVSSGASTYTGAIPANANFGMIRWDINDATIITGSSVLARVGLTQSQVGIVMDATTGTDGYYDFQWSGNNLVITENTDNNADSNLTGTAYWYK